MAKVAANAGLSPGLAVLSQKFAEMFYVAMTVFTSCAPCRAEARAPPRGARRGDSKGCAPRFFLGCVGSAAACSRRWFWQRSG